MNIILIHTNKISQEMADNFNYFIEIEKKGDFCFRLNTQSEIPPQAQEHFDQLFKFIPNILTCVGGVQFDYRIDIEWEAIRYSLSSGHSMIEKYALNQETGDVVTYSVSSTDGWMMDTDRNYTSIDPDFASFKAKLMTLAK